jgi:hypothetical protein
VLDDGRYKKRVLVGGDLNTGTQWPAHEAFLARDLNLLQRFDALGLVDCFGATRLAGRLEGCTCTFGDSCTHTQTRLDPRWPHIPYQTDYPWATTAVAERLISCRALADDDWFAISITPRSSPTSISADRLVCGWVGLL